MAAVMVLSDVVGEIDICPEEWRAYLNRKTGECWTVEDEESDELGDKDEDEDGDGGREASHGMSEEERERLAKAREVLGSVDWIGLPTMRDFDAYRVMEDFCGSVEDERLQERLCMKPWEFRIDSLA